MKRFFINATILVVVLLAVGLLSGNWPVAVYTISIGITSMFAGYDAAQPGVLKKKIKGLEIVIDEYKSANEGLQGLIDLLKKESEYLRSEKNRIEQKLASLQADNTSGFINQSNDNHNKAFALTRASEMMPAETSQLLESADKILKWLSEPK